MHELQNYAMAVPCLCSCLPSTVDLIPDNLPKLLNLLVDASPEWMDLGLQLGVNQTTLRAIRQDNHHVTKHCFTDMLSEWLKMIDPLPSWEGLFAALEQPSVGRKDLVEVIKKEIGVGTPVESDDSDGSGKHCKTTCQFD